LEVSNYKVGMPDCPFCRIIRGDAKSKKVYEDDRVFAFDDINPQAPTHVLVIPREHHADVAELSADAELLALVLREAGAVAVDEQLDSYRVVFNTGQGAGQTVFHVHAHVLGGRGMKWPPG
jgi:histidine triad (HIT) family protein